MKDDFLAKAIESSRRRYTKKKQTVILASVIFAGFSALGVQTFIQNVPPVQTSQTHDEYRSSKTAIHKPKERDNTNALSAPVATPSSNPDNSSGVMPSHDEDSRLRQALIHRDRRTFRNAASRAGSKLGDILRLLETESWISEYAYMENIHEASLSLRDIPALIDAVTPSDTDLAVRKLQQTTKDKLSQHYGAVVSSVKAFEAWKQSPSSTLYNYAKDTKYRASLTGLEFYNSLDKIPI